MHWNELQQLGMAVASTQHALEVKGVYACNGAMETGPVLCCLAALLAKTLIPCCIPDRTKVAKGFWLSR